MTGNFFLNWLALAVSLFDTIIAFWLGLTVLLNAERRSWGLLLAGGGLVLGGIFFVSHSAILGNGANFFQTEIDVWWHLGWIPVLLAPLAWYVVMLWYAGFWDSPRSALRRRHSFFLVLALGLFVALVALLIFANPFSSISQIANLNPSPTPTLFGTPLLILAYPFYLIVCLTLALDTWRQPNLTGRALDDLARRRARPWLIAASIALWIVGMLVAFVMQRVEFYLTQGLDGSDYRDILFAIGLFDLGIAALIGLAMALLGQAIVAYEIFTGKTLPRRGLYRQWRNALILAAGYGTVVAWSFTARFSPIYVLLIATLLLTVFYALHSWRTFNERERTIEQLRPFVASPRVYESLITPAAPNEVNVAHLFRALCANVLGARVGFLAAVGSSAPFFGAPIAYPNSSPPALNLNELVVQFASPQTMCVQVEPARFAGAFWAVPLWSERGLIGVLLLGEKIDGGLYTQELIEIARASGERLIDTQASTEMARRLMELQRQRLTESQIVDRRTRRALHDDVLPRIHAAMLKLASANASDEILALLSETHHDISNLLHAMPPTTAPEIARLGLIDAMRQTIDREFANAFDEVEFQADEAAVRAAQTIPPINAEVIFYAARESVRNAARYGRVKDSTGNGDPARPLHLRVHVSTREGFEIRIEDDGVGFDSRREERESDGGSGAGLTLHSTMMAVIGGALSIESERGKFTRVILSLPKT